MSRFNAISKGIVESVSDLGVEHKQLKDRLASAGGALRHIAFEPLTDDAEASAVKCLAEAVRIARAALPRGGS